MPRGVITFVFDDGYQAVYGHVLPLLRGHGMRAVFAVPVDTERLARAESAPVAPLDDWKRACAEGGHELAAHGVTHRALPPLSDAELETELKAAREATGATTLVYPGGAHDDRVVAAARRHFRAARTVRAGFETLPARAPHRLRSFVATKQNFQVWKWNLRALWAWLKNSWLIETFHDVAIGNLKLEIRNWPQHTVPLAALERHIRFVRRLPIRIATIREIL